jgi:hypothetical protein
LFELRLLLAGHLGSDAKSKPDVRAAAHLAYALHNQALAALNNKAFDTHQALEAIARVDAELGENFMQQLSEAVNREEWQPHATALALLLWTLEPNASGVSLPIPAYAPQPNESFNADANIGHRFAILMANVGALRASRSGAG